MKIMAILWGTALATGALALPARALEPPGMPVIDGSDLTPLRIDSERLDWRKVTIRDVVADQERIFTKGEERKGFKPLSFLKFILRDSKLTCFLERYDRSCLDVYKDVRKGDRVTVVGMIERVGKGAAALYNPKFVFRVEKIAKGWKMGAAEAVLEEAPPSGEYREIDPEALAGSPDEYREAMVRIRDRFSLASDYFTNFEKDLDLSGQTALKFRGELCPWPCYLAKTDENARILAGMRSGDKITVIGRLRIRPAADDQLVVISVHRLEKGWDEERVTSALR